MSLQEHVDSLQTKHARLEQLIQDELHRPLPDQSALSTLKKQKLRIKEEIERNRGNERSGLASFPTSLN